MARLLQHHPYAPFHLQTPADFGRLLLLAVQAAVLSGIALVLVLAIANTALGTSSSSEDETTTPRTYQGAEERGLSE